MLSTKGLPFGLVLLLSLPLCGFAQKWDTIPLGNLAAFEEAPKNWSIVGSAAVLPLAEAKFVSQKGTGILLNQPKNADARDLRTKLEHGDLDLELEFMMVPGSNSGIYLQGNYEIQLYDSWGKTRVGYGDVGGIYERWDDGRGEGRQGYEGYAPAMNVAKAPGTWQRIFISFAAPRFDAYGTKIANARILRIDLNGVTIHENLELTGPTRGNWFPEQARGPLRFQGDHGSVALRNIRYRRFDEPPVALENIYYEAAPLEVQDFHDWSLAEVSERGTSPVLSADVTAAGDRLGLYFRADLALPQSGPYTFDLTSFGNGTLVIDGDTLIKSRWWGAQATKELSAGNHRVEIVYAKVENWFSKVLALYVSGPGIRRQALHPAAAIPDGSLPTPIYHEIAGEIRLLRSFVDIPSAAAEDKVRLTHAVQVGFPDGIAYTYDTHTGSVVQVWRGDFLDVTPMWDSRGDGSSRPRGAVELLSLRPPALAKGDSVAIRPRGYRLDADNQPTFLYSVDTDLAVSDRVAALPDGKGLRRDISWEGNAATVGAWRVAAGDRIEAVAKDWYWIDGRYFLRLPAKNDFDPQVRTIDGRQELLLQVNPQQRISYDILW